MNVADSGEDVFRELERQNPAVARAFGTFRRHGRQMDVEPPALSDSLFGRHHYSWSPALAAHRMYDLSSMSLKHPLSWGPPLVFLGIIAIAVVVGPAVLRFATMYWKAILLPTGGVCVGAGVVLLLSRIGISSLRTVAPPKANTDDPLKELTDLAQRTGSRLRAAYRLQLWTVLAVGGIFITLIVWTIVMVSKQRLVYASAFGAGSVSMAILTQWKWQPFDRINQARRLADNADTLATGLRLRMKTISEIADPATREKAQWKAVKEYVSLS